MPLLAGDLGGCLGLCFGASLITILEFFEFFIERAYQKFIKKKAPSCMLPPSKIQHNSTHVIEHTK